MGMLQYWGRPGGLDGGLGGGEGGGLGKAITPTGGEGGRLDAGGEGGGGAFLRMHLQIEERTAAFPVNPKCGGSHGCSVGLQVAAFSLTSSLC